MERKNNNQTGTFLMVVGIIFIVVAGTIFVSKAWQYIPVIGKQLILALMTMGFFAGAKKQDERGGMQKSAAALYYLGTSFLGLLMLSLCGGMWYGEAGGWVSGTEFGWNELAVMVSGFAMLVPVTIRFVQKRITFDFVMMALLADWVVFWFKLMLDCSGMGDGVLAALAMTAYTFAYIGFDAWTNEDKNTKDAFLVLYIIHAVGYGMSILTLIACKRELLDVFGNVIMAASLFLISMLLYVAKKAKKFRIFNSLAIFWLTGWCVSLGKELCLGKGIFEIKYMSCFIFFAISLVLVVLLQRKEMIWSMVAFGGMMPFVQMLSTVGAFTMAHREMTYLPFTVVLMAAMSLLLVRAIGNGILWESKIQRYRMAIGLQVIPALVTWYGSKYMFFEKGIWTLMTVLMLTIGLLAGNETIQRTFYTMALFFGMVTVWGYTLEWFPESYQAEWVCFVIAGTVSFLEVIWKNAKDDMRLIKFVCICLLSALLLLKNIVGGGVGNALILGIAGVIMLLVAAILNKRPYVILSSVILILLVVYVTRSLWFRIAWWVYLFAAGVILVLWAMKKERQENEECH